MPPWVQSAQAVCIASGKIKPLNIQTESKFFLRRRGVGWGGQVGRKEKDLV